MLGGMLPAAAAYGDPGRDLESASMAGSSARAVHTVSTHTEFRSALEQAQDGDTIQLSADILVRVGVDDPLVIRKKISIDGGGHSLTLGMGGIVLEADLTLQEMTLGLENMVRNAIMANGHTLTLENVQQDTRAGRGEIHLFCGSLTGAETNGYTNHGTGTEGKIILRGKSSFAAVYAGNYYDNIASWTSGRYGEYAGGSPDIWREGSSLVIENSMSGKVPVIYGCGAWMSRNLGATPYPVQPDERNCPISGTFSVSLYDNAVEYVNGCGKTKVNFTGSQYLNETLTLSDIQELRVSGGSLQPIAVVSANAPLPVIVEDGAILGFNSFITDRGVQGYDRQNIDIGTFTGGGTITLGADQQLHINDTVSGQTKVALGMLFHDASSLLVASDKNVPKTLITVPTGTSETNPNAFSFLPHSTQYVTAEFDTNDDTNWVVTPRERVTLVKSFSIPVLTTVQEDDQTVQAEIELTVTDAEENGYPDAQSVQGVRGLIITIDGNEAEIENDGSCDYVITESGLKIGFGINDAGTAETMLIWVDGDSSAFGALPQAGDYRLEITIPAAYTVDGADLTARGTLRILDKNAQPEEYRVDPPQAPKLTYNGKPQTAFSDTVGYVVKDGSATHAGDYTAKLTLRENCVWSDDTTEDPREFAWSIVPAEKPEIPEGTLRAIAPREELNGDITPGMITGTTIEMEYRKKGDSGWTECKGSFVEIREAGDYEVRYCAEGGNWNAGPVRMVTVPEAIRMTSISVAAPPTRTVYTAGAGDALDLTGLALMLHWSDGAKNTLAVTDAAVQGITVSAVDLNTPVESAPVTVAFRGKTVVFNISVLAPGAPTVTGITVNSTAHKTEYQVGEALDVSGLTIEAAMSDNTMKTVAVTEGMVSGFDSMAPGVYSLTITYQGAATTYSVTVKEALPDRWTVTVNGSGAEVTGAGSYTAGSQVTVSVGEREGYTFTSWQVSGITLDADTLQNTTVRFLMPEEAVTLTAQWRQNETPVIPPEPGIPDTPDEPEEEAPERKPVSRPGGASGSSSAAPGTPAQTAPEPPEVSGQPSQTANPYPADVREGEWYYSAVQYVSANNLMSGTGNGTFSPETKLSRGMLAQILYNQEGRPAAGAGSFTDVAPGEWYTDAIGWAASGALVSGYSDGTFGPSDDITREQLVVILYRYAQMKGYDTGLGGAAGLSAYADAAQISDFARTAMEWAVSHGLITGSNTGALMPSGGATRAQAAAILMRFLEKFGG